MSYPWGDLTGPAAAANPFANPPGAGRPSAGSPAPEVGFVAALAAAYLLILAVALGVTALLANA